ncbi:MAG: transposase, partial [Verrucomicrobia bacterium]|nr:transposase [Verrucomicrobiota bacterium]
SSEIADAVRIRPIISQITSRSGGGPCTSCCGIDHRQPILNADGSRFVFSSIWNVDDYAGNLNPERNRELSTFLIASNKFQQLTITTNGMSLPYSFQGSKIGFVSCSPQFASSGTTNTDVFGYDLPSQTVTQWVNTVGIAAVQLGTNCPNAWFAASDWTSLANLHVDLSTDLRHLVWTSSRNLPSLGYPGGSNADGNYEIYWKDLASGEVRQLTGTTGGDNVSTAAGANLWPRTSGDGSKIVFVSNRSLGGPTISSNRYGLFLADANGGVQRLTAAEIQVSREFPAFGMDSAGSRVVFASDADLIGLNTNHTRQVFALDLSSSNLTQITRSGLGVTNSRPILSGDGLKVAFLSNGNLNGSASGNVEQLWVYHFDTDLAYTAPFVQVTSLSANQAATGGRISWVDWYSFDYAGSNLVFTCNADLVGSNSGHAYEVFLGSFDWQPFWCYISKLGTNPCQKTAWQVHAYCLMRNHFHLVVETPDANLVEGMRWLLSAYTIRLNHRQKLFGHVFSGRYKALIVEGSGSGYLKTACDYVHLNPVRA